MEKTDEFLEEEIPESGPPDPNHPLERAIAAFRERSQVAKKSSRAMERAARGWAVVHTDTDWQQVVKEAIEDFESGSFLASQLGGEAALAPEEMATLLYLHGRIIAERRIETAEDLMLLDLALLSYRNALRIQGWVENLAFLIEADAFGLQPPSVQYRPGHQFADGLTAEEHVARMKEQLFPLVERANRMFIRNLSEIGSARRPSAAVVAVAATQQINVGDRQVNLAP